MPHKVIVDEVENLLNSSGRVTLNENTDRLANEFDKVLYADGSTPLKGNVDADSNRIINLPDAVTPSEPVTLRQSGAFADAVAALNNYYPSKELGESATPVGQYFTYPDGSGQILYAERLPIGSQVIGQVATQAAIDALSAREAALRDSVRAEEYGVDPGASDNYSALVAAINAANIQGKPLRVPEGVFVIDQASPTLPITDNTAIVGMGPGKTKFFYTNTLDNATDAFSVIGRSGVRLEGFSVEAQEMRHASPGNVAFYFEDCQDCVVEDVVQSKFTQGLCFTRSDRVPGPSQTLNARNKAVRFVSRGTRNYGLFMEFATACEFNSCEVYNSTHYDGVKIGGGSIFCRVIGCHSEGNANDGFDTYDGFIASVMDSCTAYDNQLQGFQIKGNFGGSYEAEDFVDRESTFSNLIAVGNKYNGFLLQQVRNCTFTGLMAADNVGSGIIVNGCQGLTFGNCLAVRNTEHGFLLLSSTSRCTFTGCIALDNSYTDGTTHNGLFDGFHLGHASNNLFVGCHSLNGTQVGKQGGQGYGINTTTTATNFFYACNVLNNMTSGVGGTDPRTNNVFSTFYDSGHFYGFKAGDAGELIYERPATNANSHIRRVGGADLRLQAQAALVNIQTATDHPLRLGTNSVGRWEIATNGHLRPLANNAYDLGTSGSYARNSFVAGRRYWTDTVHDTVGAGSPEGVVHGSPGSTYRRTDGGAGSSFYVKESGTGNTGWVAK